MRARLAAFPDHAVPGTPGAGTAAPAAPGPCAAPYAGAGHRRLRTGARRPARAFAPGQDGPCHDGPCLWIADNVCAATFESWLAKLPPHETTVVCISKSGGTIETLAQYFLCRDWLRKALGERWHEHMIVVTDLHQGFLREEASRYALDSLEVPDNLGGRYSALSAVGLLPAAFLGIDWQALLDGAAAVAVRWPRIRPALPGIPPSIWPAGPMLWKATATASWCFSAMCRNGPPMAPGSPSSGPRAWARTARASCPCPPPGSRTSIPSTRCSWTGSVTRAASS